MRMLNDVTRRAAFTGLALAGSIVPVARSFARSRKISPHDEGASPAGSLTVAARSPWQVNAAAVTPGGVLFLGLPRFSREAQTPSLVRVEDDGSLTPFPGGTWGAWKPGEDGRDAFVMVNTIHIFHDGTLWAVDQGTPDESEPAPGAQKLVRLDPRTGSLLAVLRFGPEILPAGARLNDLRIHDNMIYLTDSGLGAIIVHDLTSNRTLRRLSHSPSTRMQTTMRGSGGRELKDAGGQRPQVHSDMIELSADGQWLTWSTPSGPVRRIATAALADEKLDEAALEGLVQTLHDIPTIGGTAMDTQGNLYLSDSENRSIEIFTPGGERVLLARDERLSSPDALFIAPDRTLYVPAAQIENLAQQHEGDDTRQPPYLVLSMPLPEAVGPHPLGDAVTGRSPETGLSNFYGIEHVAMTVPDHDAAVRFLQEAFGATLLYTHIKKSDPPATAEHVSKINALAPGTEMIAASQIRFANGPNIEIFELRGYGREQAAGINDMGLVHFSVIVDDIKAAAARFEKAGGAMHSADGPFDLGFNEVGEGNTNWFGQTPWGTWIEFMTFRSPIRYDPGARAERWFPARG
ncbi:VOC family protein [Novosphingobium profundi]|uniref:L-dopachrome tautomerase-related protein n=1 Tax=Novosphingobium profundi TaxID=1774954 RepID=UPI001BDB2D07|nr:L-dopachrome tautomerase-related protein [Novosphingobium profundi]MBT0670644.1 VOC family protein [Novosphingobium profundi]